MAALILRPRFDARHVRGLKTERWGTTGQGRVRAVCSCGWEGPVREGPITALLLPAFADWERHRA